MRWFTFGLMMVAATAIGCEDLSGGGGAKRSMSPEAVGVAPGTVQDYGAPVARQEAVQQPAESTPVDDAAAPEASADPAPAETISPAPGVTEEPVREKAEVGVGVKGQGLSEGVITTPAKAFFRTRERLTFVQVEQALNLYKATEGRLPQSHEEFMEKVINPNQITLPQLPAGSRYVWDPEKGELMVEKQ